MIEGLNPELIPSYLLATPVACGSVHCPKAVTTEQATPFHVETITYTQR